MSKQPGNRRHNARWEGGSDEGHLGNATTAVVADSSSHSCGDSPAQMENDQRWLKASPLSSYYPGG